MENLMSNEEILEEIRKYSKDCILFPRGKSGLPNCANLVPEITGRL